MDKMMEIMKAVDNFNMLIADVENATKENEQAVENNIQLAYNNYYNKLKPYLDIAIKLDADIYIGKYANILATNHIRMLGKSQRMMVQTSGHVIEIYNDNIRRNACGETILNKGLSVLQNIFDNDFETEFYKSVNDIMKRRMEEVDREYQKSIDMKNLISEMI